MQLKQSRENSMSIVEAVEDIRNRTNKRLDTCARQFAKTLMDSYPDLVFWQNTPPDAEDLTAAQLAHVPETVRQVWAEQISLHGHMIGPWILDVYAGSKKTVQFGNEWDEPFKFNYEAKFNGGRVPPEVANLPQPLMRDFRANKNAMRELCGQARAVLRPGKKKSQHVATDYVLEAARQVAVAVYSDTTIDSQDVNIADKLELFDDDRIDLMGDIYGIISVRTDITKIQINYEHHEVVTSVIRKKTTFIRKIREQLAQLQTSRQS